MYFLFYKLVLIVAKCIVNIGNRNFKIGYENVLIVAKCIVNLIYNEWI